MPESVIYFCPQCLTRRQTFESWDATRQRLCVKCQACGAAVEEGIVAHGEVAFRSRPVLLIDDDQLLLHLAARLLAAHCFRPLVAGDGPSGLAAARQGCPDLILLDVLMPGLDGFAVCRTLRAEPKLKETPINLITAKKDPQLRTKGFKAGATLAIEKPVDPNTLIAAVLTALELKPRAVAPAP